MHGSTNINNSPATIQIIPGPCIPTTLNALDSLPDSVWEEWNGDGTSSCYINLVCNIRLTLTDTAGNIIKIPQFFQNSDMDSFLIGPYFATGSPTTTYLDTVDNSNSTQGFYYFNYTRYRIGIYNAYLRLRNQHAPSYPIVIQIYTTSIYPPYSYVLNTPLDQQVAGVPFTYQILAKDEFNNTVSSNSGSLFTSLMELQGTSSTQYGALGQSYIGSAIYNITTAAFKSGLYDLSAYLDGSSPPDDQIGNTPQAVYVQPTYTEASTSIAQGSGIKAAVVGRVETIYLQVNDVYSNAFNDTTIKSMSVYNIYAIANGSIPIAVNLTYSYSFSAFFQLNYQLLSNYTSLIVTIQVATSNDGGTTFAYEDIPGSPFNVTIGFLDITLYNSYNDIILGGFGVSALSSINALPSPSAGNPFNVTIDPKNQYGQTFLYFETSGIYFIADVAYQVQSNPTPQYACNCQSSSINYCHFYSHNKTACDRLLGFCEWKHDVNSGIPDSQFVSNLHSCGPCKCQPPFLDYSVTQRDNGANYFLEYDNLNLTGNYLTTVHVWEIGGFQAVIYKNSDFTQMVARFKQYSLNMTFNTKTNAIFTTLKQGYSVTLQGKIRTEFNNFYNFTVYSNKQILIFLDRELVLNKTEQFKEGKSFQKEMYSYEMHDIEIYISSSFRSETDNIAELPPEYNNADGYFQMVEESGNVLVQLIKPKNMFTLVDLSNSGASSVITVLPNAANQLTSYPLEGSNQILNSSNALPNQELRAGSVLNLQVDIRDLYHNHRGQGTTDTVNMYVYINGSLSQTQNSLAQQLTYYNYEYTLTPTLPGVYSIQFSINSLLMPNQLNFNLIPGTVSEVTSTATLLGYKTYAQQDCIFVGQPFYIRIDLKDSVGNKVPFNDKQAYESILAATLTPVGVKYSPQDCYRFLTQYYSIICPFLPLAIGLTQSFDFYNQVTMSSFSTFPLTVGVYPFKQQFLELPSGIQVLKQISIPSLTSEVFTLSFQAVDIYGNLIDSELICSLFYHGRFVIYAHPLYFFNSLLVIPSSISVTEGFISATNTKSFTLTSTHAATPVFQYGQIYFNYTILDGITIDDGFLIKYYSNNNFQGKPFAWEVITTSFITNSNISSQWYKMFKNFEQFSVKITALLRPAYSESYQFLTGMTSNFELWIDDTLIIPEGLTTGSGLLVQNKWTKMKALYRSTINSGSVASIPQCLIMWQSTSQTIQQIGRQSALAFDLDDGDGEDKVRGGYGGNVLIRDYYQAF